MADQPQFELCGEPSALEFEDRMGLIFLSVGVHEFPMTCAEAELLAKRLMEMSTTNSKSVRLVAP